MYDFLEVCWVGERGVLQLRVRQWWVLFWKFFGGDGNFLVGMAYIVEVWEGIWRGNGCL
jgi:hypothetical protein